MLPFKKGRFQPDSGTFPLVHPRAMSRERVPRRKRENASKYRDHPENKDPSPGFFREERKRESRYSRTAADQYRKIDKIILTMIFLFIPAPPERLYSDRDSISRKEKHHGKKKFDRPPTGW